MNNTIQLNNGKTIPVLGFGTWQLDKTNAATSVYNAIKIGYRHIDCAAIYENEKQVGDGIKQAIKDGLVTRSELFVTSKLWNTDHDPKDVKPAFQKSLEDLGLEYLDLYLMHWAVSFRRADGTKGSDDAGLSLLTYVPVHQTWRAMEQLVNDQLVRAIGVANFDASQLIDLLGTATIRPAMNQVELHPYHTQQALVDFCKAQDIAVTAYSPLSAAGTPVLKDSVIATISHAHGKTPAQIALRWAIQRGTAAIPKATSMERIAENFDIFDFELSDAEMTNISQLDRRQILINPSEWWGYPYFS